MKKHIKSLILIGMLTFQSVHLSAFGLRDWVQGLFDIRQEGSRIAAHGVAVAVVGAVGAATSSGYSAIKEAYKRALSPENDRSYYKTAAELSHLAKHSKLDKDLAEALQNANETHSACKFIMINGDTGSGKSTTAEAIAHHVNAAGLYTIPKSRLSAKTKNFMGKTDDDNKIAVLYEVADEISAITPIGRKAVINLSEFGTEFLATGPNVEAWKDFTGNIMGDEGRAPLYPNIIFVASSNIDTTQPNQQLDRAIAGRTLQKTLNNPDHMSRMDFFKDSAINIEQNAQINARERLASAGKPVPTIFEYIQSFIQPQAYLAAEQKRKNDFFEKNMFVTDDMFTKAKNRHEDQITTMQTEANALKTPWTLATAIIPSVGFNYQVRNARAKEIEIKIKNIQRQGYTPEVVTHNLTDMSNHDLNFLAEKTTKIDKQETSKRKLNEFCMKNAQIQELKLINTIKKHIDEKESVEVTATSNPQLFDMMNNHRKYCSETLSRNAHTAEKKVLAKLPADLVSSYNIDPCSRTYRCTTATPVKKTSAPIEFGAITKAHIAAAAYGDDFASYNKKDAAASKIGKAWKAKREHIQSKTTAKSLLNNAPALD